MKTLTPEVSIVIPVYNRERTIGRAIESALEQGNNLEVIVVDDASTDATVAEIQKFADPRVRLISNPDNSGGRPGQVRNLGVKASRAPIILFLDSDDRLPPGSLLSLKNALQGKSVGMSWGYKALWRGDRRVSIAFVSSATGLPKEALPALFFNWTPGTGGLCFYREVFDSLNGFDSDLGPFEDLDFTLRFVLKGKWNIAPVKETTYDCYVTRGGSSSTLSQKYYRCLERFYQKHQGTIKKYPDAQAAVLYRLGVAAYLTGNGREGSEYFKSRIQIKPLSGKQKAVWLLLRCGLAGAVRLANRLLGRVAETRRYQEFKRAA